MSGIPEQSEDEAKPTIVHARELVVWEGEWEQDYNFLRYDFDPAPCIATAYFDEPGVVVLAADGVTDFDDVPAPVRDYLQFRFERIDSVWGPKRAMWWKRDE